MASPRCAARFSIDVNQGARDDVGWKDRLESVRRRSPAGRAAADTVEDNTKIFLQRKRVEVDAGELTASRYAIMARHLTIAVERLGVGCRMDSVSGRTLDDLLARARQQLAQRLESSEFSEPFRAGCFSFAPR